MELSAKYAYKVYENKSFSAAARSLFISQPALSAAISRLENDIGFKIFDRATVPLTLTPEGRIYIDSLEEILESESVMQQRIRRLSDMSYGNLSVGGSCLAAHHLLPLVCGIFHEQYPQIEVEIDMGNTGTQSYLVERMKKHTMDLLVGHRFDLQQYAVTPVLEEQYLVAMRRDYPGAEKIMEYAVTREELISGTYPEEKKIEDMSILRDIEFLKTARGSTPALKMEKLIGEHAVAKCYVKNVRHAGMQFSMMKYGLGAIMTSDTIVKMLSTPDDDLVFFIPKSKEGKQLLYIARDITLEPTIASRNFLNLAIDICKSGKLFDHIKNG